MKKKLEKILEIVGYSLAIGMGFVVLYFGFQLIDAFFRAILK